MTDDTPDDRHTTAIRVEVKHRFKPGDRVYDGDPADGFGTVTSIELRDGKPVYIVDVRGKAFFYYVDHADGRPGRRGALRLVVDDSPPRANMTFGMPASWEDMQALGLDPYTGEPV